MKKIFILFLFNVVSFLSYSQTKIFGKITDTKGETLIGVNISIKGSYDGATSNSKGEYNFETEKKDSAIISISYTGFVGQEKKIFLAGKEMQINFSMKERINDLKAVVISAGSFEASDEKKGTVLKALDIVTTAGSNGDSYGALKTLPGTQQTNDREGLFVRGGTGSETQTFIDGTWVKNAFTTSVPDLGARGRFNPFIFKGTVFSAGGYSALYGQALSSAVILETIDLPDRSSANLNMSSVGIGASIQQLAKNKKSSFGIGYNYTNLSPYFALVKQNVSYKQAPVSHQIDLNYRIKTSKTGMFKFYGYYNQTNIDIQRDDITSFDYNDVNKEYKDEYGVKNKNAYLNFSYKEYLSKTWKLNIGAAFSKNKDNIETKVLQNNMVVNDTNFTYNNWINIKNTNYLATTKLVLEKSFNNLNTLRFGGEYIYTNDKNLYENELLKSFINYPTYKTQEHYKAIFAESDIYLTNDIAGKIGVRAEHSSIINKMNIVPRASLAYKLKKAGQVSVAYGMFYQKPDQNYLYRNQALNYQRADHYIINYQYQPKDRILRLEAYYKKYHNLIKSYPNFIYNNNGEGYAKGIELFYRDKKSIKGLDYWISYSFIDTKRNFLNYSNLVQPDFVAKHTASLVMKKFWTKYMFGINATYSFATGRPYINYNTSNPNDPSSNVNLFMTDKTISYNNLSISANYIKTIRKAFTVFVFSVNNPFRFKQVYGYNYATKDLNNDGLYYRRAITPAARQFIFIGMFMSFGIDRTQEAIDNNL